MLTISRELGSKGSRIGKMVADALGYLLVDKGSIEMVFREYSLQTYFQELYDSEPNLW
ncbi:MAG: cytidylate kinase family protein [Planctomycetota bacterium]